MTTAVRRLKTGDFVSSTMFLAFVSFMYGVLHAVGPGHGKFVISSYALANEQTVRRGIVLSFMAALVQALSAIALVSVAIMVFRATSVEMRQVEAWLEMVSWGLIAGLGLWMLWRQVGPLLAARNACWQRRCRSQVTIDHAHDHGHNHDHHAHGHHDHGHDHGCAPLPAPPTMSTTSIADICTCRRRVRCRERGHGVRHGRWRCRSACGHAPGPFSC